MLRRMYAVAPEWISAVDVTAALVSLAIAALAARWLWRWIRWWSLPISLAVTLVAVVIAVSSTDDLLTRMRQPPEEGVYYSGSFVCSTSLKSVFRNARTNDDRIYVLQRSCIPDGPEDRTFYKRHGSSPLMRQVDSEEAHSLGAP